MKARRLPLIACLALGPLACAPGGDDTSDAPSVPPGFELASAEQPDGAFGQTAPHSAVVDLSVSELQELRSSQDIWLIDVRTDEEVADGMIAGAHHIELAQFIPGESLMDQAKGREIVLYCRSGRRSAKAAQSLSDYAGQPVKHLAGGFNAWRDAGGKTE